MESQTSTAPQTIAIIGQGAYGSALGRVMSGKGHTVRFFDKNHPGLPAKYPPLADVLAGATVIILAIPSQFVPEFLPTIPAEFRNLPFISAVKGILDPAVFTGFPEYAILSGPAFDTDLDRKLPTTLTASDPIVANLLATDWLTIELTSDIIGVMACGALKNCYAIGAGFLELQPDTPTFDEYIAKTLNELKTAIQILGGHPETADLACGIGDLKLTCGSNKSRNYQFGQMLNNAELNQDSLLLNAPTNVLSPNSSPKKDLQTTEGLTTLRTLPKDLKRLPILHELILLTRNESDTLNIGDINPI
ncbi:hypothetical protein FWG76_02810 [Candidatus Saccharibacteria bacterium]|nr:hypothetical protein [Candidatus Saccharibacteria bacterium]